MRLAFCGPSIDEQADGYEEAERQHKREAILGNAFGMVVIEASRSSSRWKWLPWYGEGMTVIIRPDREEALVIVVSASAVKRTNPGPRQHREDRSGRVDLMCLAPFVDL